MLNENATLSDHSKVRVMYIFAFLRIETYSNGYFIAVLDGANKSPRACKCPVNNMVPDQFVLGNEGRSYQKKYIGNEGRK